MPVHLSLLYLWSGKGPSNDIWTTSKPLEVNTHNDSYTQRQVSTTMTSLMATVYRRSREHSESYSEFFQEFVKAEGAIAIFVKRLKEFLDSLQW